MITSLPSPSLLFTYLASIHFSSSSIRVKSLLGSSTVPQQFFNNPFLHQLITFTITRIRIDNKIKFL
ncbi:hypothetical protein EYC84_002606 [Monilinia fructicola]|uniref:Uncharacterized protein n=1 Tax=Monilinia fructicola TaxID=38448 RepID=A0A5M9JR87_MONFR|nr:hypothetical protein EYC84_002606 [Monilinia fructicola]